MWDALQREMLDALGHTLYQQRALGEASVQSLLPAGLLVAIARAAGIAPDRLASELPGLPSPQLLRGDAAAKRALWPRLRALRSSSSLG